MKIIMQMSLCHSPEIPASWQTKIGVSAPHEKFNQIKGKIWKHHIDIKKFNKDIVHKLKQGYKFSTALHSLGAGWACSHPSF